MKCIQTNNNFIYKAGVAALIVPGAVLSVVADTGATIYQCRKISRLHKENQISVEDKNIEIRKKFLSASGGISLGLIGGAAGAVAGTAIGPGIGTVVGFAVGNIIGNVAGKVGGHVVAGYI